MATLLLLKIESMVDQPAIKYLRDLAKQLEGNDYFDENAKEFIEWANWLKKDIEYQSRDQSILAELRKLPEIEIQAYSRSLLEQLLPKNQRNMVGKYKTREIIRGKVQQTMRIFEQIDRWTS